MKHKWGKLALELVVISVLSAVILAIVNWAISLITVPQEFNVFYKFLLAVIAVGFFGYAMKINPGKEEFLTTVPLVILSLAVVELMRNWLTIVPTLALEMSWIGLAWGLGGVFLASAITRKYIIK